MAATLNKELLTSSWEVERVGCEHPSSQWYLGEWAVWIEGALPAVCESGNGWKGKGNHVGSSALPALKIEK
eukprot:209686-Pelagomonas_calceolata.AAC.1